MRNRDNVAWTDHLAELTSAPTASAMNRRRFLQGLLATGAVASVGSLGWPASHAEAAPADSILLIIMMGGGNDGMSMLIPATNGNYQDARRGLAISPGDALSIGSGLYINENLPSVKSRWDAGNVAFVQGVGEAEDDHSHFSSMARWMGGHSSGIGPSFTGWLGRWADAANAGDFGSISIGDNGIPLHMRGLRDPAIGLPSYGSIIGANPEPWEAIAFNAMQDISRGGGGRGGLYLSAGQALDRALGVAGQVASVFADPPLPNDGLIRELEVAARTINLGLGTRVVAAGYGDFDTHDDHDSRHPVLMTELDQAINRFYQTLNPAYASKVTIMTFSEFGRSWFENDSAGVDHGTASTLMLIGDQVKGGLYGEMPSFTNRDDVDDLHHRVDYRSVYASVINGWLGGDSHEVLGANYEDLNLFAPDVPVVTASCLGRRATIIGSAGADTIQGTAGDDVIVTFEGNDLIYGGGGNDIICAGDGADEIYGGDGRDKIFGEAGADYIDGEGGSDFLYGEGAKDTIEGGSGADRIYGGPGDDTITGQGGKDRIWGDSGDDEIQGNHQSDVLNGGTGRDVIRGAGGKDTLTGGSAADELYGGDNSDTLTGGSGPDMHDGQKGGDSCVGDGDSGDLFNSC